MERFFEYDSVEWNEDKTGVRIIDQTLLPSEEVFLTLRTPQEIYEAIYHLRVRGAPAIGVAAAFGLYVSILPIDGPMESFVEEFRRIKGYLLSSRPTAVNLSYALERMENCLKGNIAGGLEVVKSSLLAEAEAIKGEDILMCRAIAENGLSLMKRGTCVLTHCNAGHLAVSRYGTALGPVHLAQQRGLEPKVFVDETRPLLQGGRLTAYEMVKSGVDATLICDNMAATVMSQGKVDMIFVGCDRVAANGDTANKIGTMSLAVLAKHFGVPFYVLGPSSTIDPNCKTGKDIVIEQRRGTEITDYDKIKVYNPAFDVTPAELISGIITEKGIFRPPFDFRIEK